MYSAFSHNPEEMPSEVEKIIGKVEKVIGKIRESECCVPGIFYLSAQREDSPHGMEYYLVHAESVSAEAATFGEPIPDCPDYLFYPMDGEPRTRKIVEYAIQLSGIRRHSQPPENSALRQNAENPALRQNTESSALRETALYGMGECPAYFGMYPAPVQTPYGYNVRYKTIMNGVFRVDTDRGIQTLAVSYPVWEDIFSRYVRRLANEEDVRRDRDGYGFLYFEGNSICLALFELRLSYRAVRESSLTDAAALMNAVWMNFPGYAARFNLMEQGGDKHHMPGRMFSGTARQIPEHMIQITPDAGTVYWRL